MKSPSLSAVAVPISISPFRRVIVELASAVPVIVGVVLSVTGEEVAKEEGASGAVASIVIEIESDSDEGESKTDTDPVEEGQENADSSEETKSDN